VKRAFGQNDLDIAGQQGPEDVVKGFTASQSKPASCMAAALSCPTAALQGPRIRDAGSRSNEAAIVAGPELEQGRGLPQSGFEYPRHVQDRVRAISVENVFACLQEVIDSSSTVEATRARPPRLGFEAREAESVLAAGVLEHLDL
jgi:hypothetical protein